MNPDRDRTETISQGLDDDQLGELVRSVADEWRMPPQRLDLPTWRERAGRSPSGRRVWVARVAMPAAAAVAATVVLAVAAVWLTSPRSDRSAVGKSPAPSVAPSTSGGPAVTPLPKLVRNGALPSVTRVMVGADGNYRVADLTTGALGVNALRPYGGQTRLVQRADGGWLCLCVKWLAVGPNGPTDLSLSLAAVDTDGRPGTPREVRQVHGTADPKLGIERQFGISDVAITVSPDGTTAFFAWTARNGSAGWTSGIDVIDVATGSVAGSKTLVVEQPTGVPDGPITRNAPSVTLSPAGDRLFMASFWYLEDPADPNPPAGTDHWTAPFDGQAIGPITVLPSSSARDCSEFDSGLIDSSSYYVVCAGASGDLTVRRSQLDGPSIGDTTVPWIEGEFSGGSLIARAGAGLVLWDPASWVMSRVDLGSGELTRSQPTTASRDGGPIDMLAALGRRVGRWIAPSVLAKLLLEPGIVVSPDGTRVYAIGVSSPTTTDRGSTGIFAFNADTLAQLGHWAPTADFTSIAVSADGRFVYAAGLGGHDADGRSSPNGASVTVFDVGDGSVRLIAGELGSSDLWFLSSTLQ